MHGMNIKMTGTKFRFNLFSDFADETCQKWRHLDYEFVVQVTVHRDKFLKPTRFTNFSNLFLE